MDTETLLNYRNNLILYYMEAKGFIKIGKGAKGCSKLSLDEERKMLLEIYYISIAIEEQQKTYNPFEL